MTYTHTFFRKQLMGIKRKTEESGLSVCFSTPAETLYSLGGLLSKTRKKKLRYFLLCRLLWRKKKSHTTKNLVEKKRGDSPVSFFLSFKGFSSLKMIDDMSSHLHFFFCFLKNFEFLTHLFSDAWKSSHPCIEAKHLFSFLSFFFH